MEEMHMYYLDNVFTYYVFLELPRKLYFILGRYELDRISASMNQTSFIFVHYFSVYYARIFSFLNGINFLNIVNPTLEVLSVKLYFDIFSIVLLVLCVVLIIYHLG